MRADAVSARAVAGAALPVVAPLGAHSRPAAYRDQACVTAPATPQRSRIWQALVASSRVLELSDEAGALPMPIRLRL